MKRIGIFGGAFNPPHIGHIQAAAQAASLLGLSKVLLIPAGQVPGKPLPDGTPEPWQRLELLRRCVGEYPNFEVLDLELTREGSSYTWDTLKTLRGKYLKEELVLMLGADAFLRFPHWKNAKSIWKEASIAVLCRGDKAERAAAAKEKKALEAKGAKVTLVENDAVSVSSTQLRRLLAFGCGWEFLPAHGAEYIREEGLYYTAANWKNLPMDRLEEVVLSLLNPNRVKHVLGCRDTAVALARRWGADETDAARAGLLHDITKALDGPLQLTLCRTYGKILDEFSQKYPKTLHALTGSLVAERIFGENKAVVSAICHHTTGCAEMNLLDTIIYVADYIEPNRDFPGVERLRRLADRNLREALKLGLEMTLDHLKDQGSEVSSQTRETLRWLEIVQS